EPGTATAAQRPDRCLLHWRAGGRLGFQAPGLRLDGALGLGAGPAGRLAVSARPAHPAGSRPSGREALKAIIQLRDPAVLVDIAGKAGLKAVARQGVGRLSIEVQRSEG